MSDAAAAPLLRDHCLKEHDIALSSALINLKVFYQSNDHIHESHGLDHALAVLQHAQHAVEAYIAIPLSSEEKTEILLAALLHDVDDRKYFGNQQKNKETNSNARLLLKQLGVSCDACERILSMIDLVSCSKHGNSCPDDIRQSGAYHLLIPRWSDRLEAVGRAGVIRCYQFTLEQGQSLSSDQSPRPQTIDDVWKYATPERFRAYQTRGGSSQDMISHYDKLLHVACPPKDIVQNSYLQEKARDSSKELLEVCLRFGRTGVVDEEYIRSLMEDDDE